MESNPTPTIAELWRELQKEEKTLISYTDLSKNDGWWIQPTLDSLSRFQSLRAQLVDRCKRPPRVAMAGSVQFFIDSHKEHSAYHAFKAWELEQRKKGAQA